jgi:hypothetical protein
VEYFAPFLHEVKMKITKLDMAQMKNLINALEGAKYPDLDGKNIIALARCFEWLAGYNNRMKQSHEESEALASIKEVESESLKDQPSEDSESSDSK